MLVKTTYKAFFEKGEYVMIKTQLKARKLKIKDVYNNLGIKKEHFYEIVNGQREVPQNLIEFLWQEEVLVKVVVL